MDDTFSIKNTHVPDKVYAYMIQALHMVYVLVRCKPGDVVNMEVIDDVGIIGQNELVEAIQIKSVTSDRNPLADKAVDLWKTFYNWLMSAKEGEIQVDKIYFKLFVTINKMGNIVNLFSNAKNEEEAMTAWQEAKKIFFEDDGKMKEVPDTYSNYVSEFLDENNLKLALKIIIA